MNYYGLFMSLGWIYIFKSLDSKSFNINIEYLALFFGVIVILGSKLFQKIFRDTWTGNASHGAFFGAYLGLCLLHKFFDPMHLLNECSFKLPILFFLIRLGNYFNQEHFRNKNYLSLIEGFFQGPIALLFLYVVKPKDPIIIFITFVSLIRIIFEFLRDNFDIKNIIFCLVTIITSFYLPIIINFNGLFIALFLLDRICKHYLDKRYIIKNYGFNLSFLSDYPEINKYIHLILFIVLLRNNFFKRYLKSNLILLGILNNLFDRLYFGYVIDYIHVYKYCFNIADIMIIIGLIYNNFLIIF